MDLELNTLEPDPTMRCTVAPCAYHWSGWDSAEDRAHYVIHPNGGGYREDPNTPSPRCESGWTGDRCTKRLFHEGPHSND